MSLTKLTFARLGMKTGTTAFGSILGAVISAALATPVALSQDTSTDGTNEPPRVTRSGAGFERDRTEGERRDSSEFVESVTVPERLSRTTVKYGDSQVASLTSGEAWIYDATTELFDDYDADGYYTYLRVRFDADSLYNDHYVFARLYISENGEFWEEYHVTDDFLIDGSSPFDDFEVETELVSGFPPGLYDVLIELYDADFGDFLDEFGPVQSSAFSLLPLEDTSFDGIPPAPVIVVSEEHGGGGAADWLSIGLLIAALGFRIGHRGRTHDRMR